VYNLAPQEFQFY